MEPNNNLLYNYDNYEEDFHEEGNDKNKAPLSVEIQAEPEPPQPPKSSEPDEKYDDDFDQDEASRGIGTPNSKLQDVTASRKVYPNSPNREKMIEQNIKLKTQIYELAKQMDEIIQREKKSRKYGIHADEGEEDEAMKSKKSELKKQQVEIMNLKNKIYLTKRQLEHVYDSRGVQSKEDELKNLQMELKVLQDEKEALTKVKKEQSKALKLIRNDTEYEAKVKQLREQLSKTKTECKNLSELLLQNERVLRKNHEIYITKQAKIKEMEAKIKENKEKGKKQSSQPANSVTQTMIDELDQQIADLEKERKESEKSWNEKISNIEGELQAKRVEEEKKLLILKEREKELKLNEIRIKELKKLLSHNEHPTKKQQPAAQPDMKEFRHKRNIRQLEK